MSQTLISRATWTDDDGTGTTGTVINNARLAADVYDKVDGLFDGAREEVGPLTVSAQLRCAVTLAADQTINDDTETSVAWDTEEHDTGGLHESVTNPSRITVPTGGCGAWLVGATIAWAASNTASYRAVYVRKNGATYMGEVRNVSTTAAGGGVMSQTVVIMDPAAAATDYYEIRVRQNRGGTLNVLGSTGINTSRAWAIKVA